MAASLQPLNLSDFTGGLNLRGDAFQLQDNESPEMRNVDVDPRGGVRSRRGWEKYNATAVTGTWLPQRLHVFDQSDGSRDVVLVSNGNVFVAAAGVFTQLSDAAVTVPAAAPTHGVDFAEWGNILYMACGSTATARKWVGSGNAVALTSSGPTFQNDYTAPVGGFFPACNFATTYQGYMVAAWTRENGVNYPNRVRFSHPNSPENWKSTDFVDIEAGGSAITGVVSFADHVVVFKTNSVWAIFGYDADSFATVNISMAVGAIHRNAIALAPSVVYFYSHPDGVHSYTPGKGVDEVSIPLRAGLDANFNGAALSKVSLGYLNRKLWFGAPYERDAVATTARTVFVFDPSMGSWTLHNDADGDGLGPFATGGLQGVSAVRLACHQVHAFVLGVDGNDNALDTIDAAAVGFPSSYSTRWLHANWAALRKSWRRPDYVVTEMPSQYSLTVTVTTDYEEANVRGTHVVVVESGAAGAWGTGTWGAGGAFWGVAPRGAHLERGGSIGLAKAVQLRFAGQVGKPWGLNAVVMKFRPRRFR